jgi:thiol-disulfide isomerase/thioredoxin
MVDLPHSADVCPGPVHAPDVESSRLGHASGIMRGMTHPKRAPNALRRLVLLLVLALCASACAAASLPHPMIGHAATEIAAEYVGGEGPRTLKGALGKVVVLDFWATWCGPCQQSFPAYARIADEFHGDVVVIGVSVDDPEDVTKEKILAFAAKAHAAFPILWDKDGSAAAIYGGRLHLPSTFILDRSGTVRRLHQGYGPYHAATVAREVKELLAEATPGPALSALSVWAPHPLSCESESKPEVVEPLRRSSLARCKDDACRKKLERLFACNLCRLASCCAEMQACSPDAFPPASTARAQAAACACHEEARLRGHADAEGRCGPPNDLSRADAACAAAHCADACTNEKPIGGPP